MPAVPWEKFGISRVEAGSIAHFIPPCSGVPCASRRSPARIARARAPGSFNTSSAYSRNSPMPAVPLMTSVVLLHCTPLPTGAALSPRIFTVLSAALW